MKFESSEDNRSHTSSSEHRIDEQGRLRKQGQTVESIQAWFIAKLASSLGMKPSDIDISEPFASYGLASVDVVGLSGELEDWLERQLSPTLLYDHPTIESLAQYLVEDPHASETATLCSTPPKVATEPIAIIGVGCRFPGAKDPHTFWRLLCDGVDAVTEVPGERWDIGKFYNQNTSMPGKMNSRWGGFLGQVDQFDAQFFGISPREAARMDPQQRLLLEVVWEALEDAGQVPEHLAGTPTGVFIGIANSDYGRMQFSDPELSDAYAGTGSAFSVSANRISYLLDWRGPSMAVDTACSSSLVAVHLACQSLWNGEATLALVGGVNLILSPELTVNFTKAGFMAPDGRCKAFAAGANGYVRGEGAGAVLLKPLARALDEGDPVYAVIRGSSVNQDGRTNGLTAPNRQAQEAMLHQAYQRAGVSPGRVQYVEAHGTGTALGDPIEAKALGSILAIGRSPGDPPCMVGSVKTNIGHLEAAAGIAGLIKVALSLRYGMIPPSLHFSEPNPYIPFAELPLQVQTTLTPWPRNKNRSSALAGVSSFGFGGTNAHVVLEEAFQTKASSSVKEALISNPAQLLPLSARSPAALEALAHAYQDVLGPQESRDLLPLSDICYTASARRNHHDYRLAIVAHTHEELSRCLGTYLKGEACQGMVSGRKDLAGRPQLAFVFPGQGSQWVGMGRQLLEQEPVFAEALARCEQAMQPYVDWSLHDILTAEEEHSPLEQIEVIQPTIFAIQVALAALWRSWGIVPDAVVGHSMGEVAAAYVAGSLSLEDATQVICRRSKLLRRVRGQGAMAVVELSLEQAEQVVAQYVDRLSVAVSNSPRSTVLSGEPAALEEVLSRLDQHNVFCRRVNVDVASHSPQMEPLRAELLQALHELQPRLTTIPMYSTVTNALCTGQELDATYWVRNLRDPVRFATTLQRLVAGGHTLFLELSPHPVLLAAIQEGLDYLSKEGVVLPSIRRGQGERAVLLASLGALYAHGYPVDWRKLYPGGGRCVPLPTYPWQRKRFWLEGVTAEQRSISSQAQTRAVNTVVPPVLDQQLNSALKEIQYNPGSPSFLADHLQEKEELLVAEQREWLRHLEQAPLQERRVLLENHIQGEVNKVMGFEPSYLPGLGQSLFEMGMDSLMAVELKNRLERNLGHALPATVIFNYPTIEALARYLAENPQQTGAHIQLPLIALQRAGFKRSFFCAPGVLGTAFAFNDLARYLGPDQPFYALQAPGIEGEQEPFTRVEDMAAWYIEAIRVVQPEGPYLLGGWSFGGVVAFEMACQLQRQGHEVGLLAMIDTPLFLRNKPIQSDHGDSDNNDVGALVDVVRVIEYLLGRNELVSYDEMQQIGPDEQINYLISHIASLWPIKAEHKQASNIFQVAKANMLALKNYAPQIYPNRITFFRATMRFSQGPQRVEFPEDLTRNWEEFSNEPLHIYDIPGDHVTIVKEPHVQVLAERLKSCLNAVQVGPTNPL